MQNQSHCPARPSNRHLLQLTLCIFYLCSRKDSRQPAADILGTLCYQSLKCYLHKILFSERPNACLKGVVLTLQDEVRLSWKTCYNTNRHLLAPARFGLGRSGTGTKSCADSFPSLAAAGLGTTLWEPSLKCSLPINKLCICSPVWYNWEQH